jgi:hypothetical protein
LVNIAENAYHTKIKSVSHKRARPASKYIKITQLFNKFITITIFLTVKLVGGVVIV